MLKAVKAAAAAAIYSKLYKVVEYLPKHFLVVYY